MAGTYYHGKSLLYVIFIGGIGGFLAGPWGILIGILFYVTAKKDTREKNREIEIKTKAKLKAKKRKPVQSTDGLLAKSSGKEQFIVIGGLVLLVITILIIGILTALGLK